MAKCKATSKAGKPCKAAAIKGSDRCLFHNNIRYRRAALRRNRRK